MRDELKRRERLILKSLAPHFGGSRLLTHIRTAKYTPALTLGAHLDGLLKAMAISYRRVKS